MKKKGSKFFCNSKNTVAMLDIDDFKRHGGGTVNGIFIATSGAKSAMAAERNKLKITTIVAAVHGTTIRRVTTIKHLLDVFDN